MSRAPTDVGLGAEVCNGFIMWRQIETPKNRDHFSFSKKNLQKGHDGLPPPTPFCPRSDP